MSHHEHQPYNSNIYPGWIKRKDYEVDYLANLLHVPASLVEEAMASAGTNRHSVKKYIKRHWLKRDGR
jgi:hypothetical protein